MTHFLPKTFCSFLLRNHLNQLEPQVPFKDVTLLGNHNKFRINSKLIFRSWQVFFSYPRWYGFKNWLFHPPCWRDNHFQKPYTPGISPHFFLDQIHFLKLSSIILLSSTMTPLEFSNFNHGPPPRPGIFHIYIFKTPWNFRYPQQYGKFLDKAYGGDFIISARF